MHATFMMAIQMSVAPAHVPGILNYQGRLTVGEVNFDGGGLFKFALVDANGIETYWSNDGTSQAGGEPDAAVAVNVRRGLYSVLLGDTSIPNMNTIPSSVFNNMDVRLRVWFNDGTKGWQKLSPDQRIAAVGYAMMAGSVPNGSITTAKIADGAITNEKLAMGAALANINSAGQATVPSGGMILSSSENQTLLDAGYIKVGSALLSNAAPSARSDHVAVWTGSEMIIWGGASSTPLFDGAIYNPGKKTWRTMSKLNAPPLFTASKAVWTGSEMIVWNGGVNGGSPRGAIYNPQTDSWRLISMNSAPSPRLSETCIWTGEEMIVWGGRANFGAMAPLNTGARYNPSKNEWTATTTSGAPTPRFDHSAIFTGTEMIIFGGESPNGDLSKVIKYNPITDTWTSTVGSNSPTFFDRHSAFWTGSKMITFGGSGEVGGVFCYPMPICIYDLEMNSWEIIDSAESPDVTIDYRVAWTGSKLMVVGGVNNEGTYSKNAFIFDPVSKNWSGVEALANISQRKRLSLVRANEQMIAWGGYHDSFGFFGDGATFNPSTNFSEEIGSATFLHLYQKP